MQLERIRSLATIALVLLALPGCFGPQIQGSGNAIQQPRSVAGFRRIEIKGSTDVVATVGPATQVTVSGDDNIVPHVRTEVRGDTLIIDMERGSYSPRADLVVTISTPALDGVSISGSADAQVKGVVAERFDAHISGSGNLDVRGTARQLEASISGSGDMRLYGLSCGRASVEVSGSGNVELTAAEALDAQISGSGDVRYRGRPHTQVKVSGSGSVEPG
ncbi:MAG TPA: head GIN domain-containing protein [Kofleriaceae bacterium]|nr:head GIN domain-containing protein [Kofleriaceae bacterium]